MGETTGIAWCHHTLNGWIGCSKVDALCTHCYADELDKRVGGYGGARRWGPGVQRHRTSAATWNAALKWDRAAEKAGERRRVFCSSLADVFDAEVPPEWRWELWSLIAKTPHLDWLLLTKRPENIPAMLPSHIPAGLFPDVSREWPWSHVWLGTSVGNQESADKRIPLLLKVPAAVRFLSCEPLLGSVDLNAVPRLPHQCAPSASGRGIAWVIVGGESGPGARPMEVSWARGLLEQCRAAAVPAFMKQLGRIVAWEDGRMTIAPHDDPKGGDPLGWPADLRVREFPEARP